MIDNDDDGNDGNDGNNGNDGTVVPSLPLSPINLSRVHRENSCGPYPLPHESDQI